MAEQADSIHHNWGTRETHKNEYAEAPRALDREEYECEAIWDDPTTGEWYS